MTSWGNCARSWPKEKIPADEDALALLAEAGDGSMRDALSILDQAIASTSEHLTADSVRSLIGSAPAAALETVMQAVAESSSEKILVLVDELIGEGHSPTHFARQLVRFLRNVTVAKIAGKDSALLQISSDERARVGRLPICSAKKTWRGICRSCCARMENSDTGRSSAFTLSWDC